VIGVWTITEGAGAADTTDSTRPATFVVAASVEDDVVSDDVVFATTVGAERTIGEEAAEEEELVKVGAGMALIT
jgi:hypothetical protein